MVSYDSMTRTFSGFFRLPLTGLIRNPEEYLNQFCRFVLGLFHSQDLNIAGFELVK